MECRYGSIRVMNPWTDPWAGLLLGSSDFSKTKLIFALIDHWNSTRTRGFLIGNRQLRPDQLRSRAIMALVYS